MIGRIFVALLLVGCTPSQRLAGNETAVERADSAREVMLEGKTNATAPAGEGVANLPFSHGKSFRTLDEYLAHLERYAAPIDQPWWREIRPGVYEHVKRMPGASAEIATRAELMKRFGFSS